MRRDTAQACDGGGVDPPRRSLRSLGLEARPMALRNGRRANTVTHSCAPSVPSACSQQDPKVPRFQHTFKASTLLLYEKGLRAPQPENLARSCKEREPGEEGRVA